MNIKNLFQKKQTTAPKGSKDGLFRKAVQRSVSTVRKDIGSFQAARKSALRAEAPKQHLMQELYENSLIDALLSSQVELRINKSTGCQFTLTDAAGKDNDAATQAFRDLDVFSTLTQYIIESRFYGNSLVEFGFNDKGKLECRLIPRAHVSPADGIFYREVNDSEGIAYRDMREYGTWLVEFRRYSNTLGLFEKTTVHVLIKRFAQSCWSELCEIYGIPPRVLKTDTTSHESLQRAKEMMSEIGSAASFIIDTDETFEFAANMTQTNGDVYNNLIALCNSEISMCITGAVIGQDTVNGNRSKEESSNEIADRIVLSDYQYIESTYNSIILPALAELGLVPDGLKLSLKKEANLESLWKMTHEACMYFDVDPEWIRQTFGIEIVAASPTPDRSGQAPQGRGGRLTRLYKDVWDNPFV